MEDSESHFDSHDIREAASELNPSISRRDWFAGMAISSIAPLFIEDIGIDPPKISKQCYEIADAMIKDSG